MHICFVLFSFDWHHSIKLSQLLHTISESPDPLAVIDLKFLERRTATPHPQSDKNSNLREKCWSVGESHVRWSDTEVVGVGVCFNPLALGSKKIPGLCEKKQQTPQHFLLHEAYQLYALCLVFSPG